MRNTENYNFNLPEETDFYNVEHFNENFTAVDKALSDFKDGTQQVGDSAKLDGKDASEYILVNGASYPYYPDNKTEEAIDSVYDSLFSNASNNSYSVAIVDHNIAHSILAGGRHIVETFKATAVYGYQISTSYNTSGTTRFSRSCINGDWKQWDSYLPLSGGRLSKNKITVLEIENTASNASVIDFYGQDGVMGALGFNGKNVPIFRSAENTANTILHTGNKPTGTYTGNGSATERIIAVGGIGSAVVITNNSNYDIAVLYPTAGYIGHKSNVFTAGSGAYLNANNCDITLKTADALLNASGVTYRWRVI